jgi:hypothetical protein
MQVGVLMRDDTLVNIFRNSIRFTVCQNSLVWHTVTTLARTITQCRLQGTAVGVVPIHAMAVTTEVVVF